MGHVAKPVKIDEPVILIRISKLYRPEMSADELYDTTRGIWKVGEKREKVQYAFAVFKGVVQEVYKIDEWHPVKNAKFETSVHEQNQPELLTVNDRWVFTGRVADEAIRSRYKDSSVADYFQKGARWPFRYINVL